MRSEGIDSIDIFNKITTGLLILLIFVMPGLSFDYGMTWDEKVRVQHGRTILKYYRSVFSDLKAVKPKLENSQLRLYGASPDTFSAGLASLLSVDVFKLRHVINALFGWLVIFYAARLATSLYGPVAGFVTVLLMVISPRFIGHAMNNSKDIPFAAFFIAAVYYMLQYAQERLIYKRRQIAMFIVFAALCLSVRPGGLLLLPYFTCIIGFLMLRWFLTQKRMDLKYLSRGVIFLTLAFILVPPLGSLFWPWALQSPYIRVFQALSEISMFPWTGSVLYSGAYIEASHLPWHYIPVWITITIPLIIPVFFFTSIGRALYQRDGKTLFLVFFAAFPIIYVIFKKSVLYDGWRHMLFVYPMIVVVSSATLNNFIQWAKNQKIRMVLTAAFIGLLSWDAAWFTICEHPNQVVYFNPIVSGTKGSLYSFELDYWGNSLKQSAKWLHERALSENRKIHVRSYPAHIGAYEAGRYDNLIVVEKNEEYFFSILRNSPEKLKAMLNNPNLVHSITVDGVPIGVIIKKDSSPN